MTSAIEPVTVVVTRRVRRGCEARYEAWLDRLVTEASALPGFLGMRLLRPEPGAKPVYASIFRFATASDLQRFEASDLRRNALADVVELVAGDPVWHRLTGLEMWFTPPAGTVVPQPSRWRMALLMVAVVYGLVLSLGSLVAWALAPWPAELRLLVTIVVEVALMTWVIMPRLTRWLARWIYPRTR